MVRTKSLNNAQYFVLDNAQHVKMITSHKRKWRYKRPSRAMSRPKRIKLLRREDNDIHKFVNWCKEVGIRISKQVASLSYDSMSHARITSILLQVSLTRRGSCANIGMIARKPIAEGTCLAKIPRAAILCCSNSELHEIIKSDDELYSQLPQLTSWLPLILTLLYEQDKKVENIILCLLVTTLY